MVVVNFILIVNLHSGYHRREESDEREKVDGSLGALSISPPPLFKGPDSPQIYIYPTRNEC